MSDNVSTWWPSLLRGTELTIEITLLSMLLALVWGLVLALPRLGTGHRGILAKILGIPAEVIVEVWRGTPLLVQLFYIFYVLPYAGIRIGAFLAGVLGLGMNYGAYMSEVYRGGIQAVPREQWEAAEALGLSNARTMRRIILPQAVRIIIPTFANYLVSCFKDSSLVSTISISELLFTGQRIGADTFDYVKIFTIVGAIYLVISIPTSRFARWLETRMRAEVAV